MSSGRRKGNPDTRQAVLTAARQMFAEHGFDGTSLRAIASLADVDVALISHYFGNKRGLFFEAVAPPVEFIETIGNVVERPYEEWPRLLLENVVRLMESPFADIMIANFRGVIRESTSSQMMGHFMVENVAKRLTMAVPDHIDGDRAWRANLLASQMVGLLVARYILKLEPLASATPNAIILAYEPTIRRYLFETVE